MLLVLVEEPARARPLMLRPSEANPHRRSRTPLLLLTELLLAVLQGHLSRAADAPKRDDYTIPQPSFGCTGARATVEHLICAEPSLAALDAAMAKAFRDYLAQAANAAARDARLADQRVWLAGRDRACPAVTPPQPGVRLEGALREVAVACTSRIYEQRVAVLRYESNAAAWPNIRFRPAIVEGAGTKLCEDLERDLLASFLGRGLIVNPLGEREIGFAPVPGLSANAVVLRAGIDVYNRGKPFPVLQWVRDNGGLGLPTAEYRAFGSPAELLSVIGHGVEPLEHSVHEAAHPVIEIDRLLHPDTRKRQTRPQAAFARDSILTVDQLPRFFRYDDHVYLLASIYPVPGKPGDLGVYRLYGPAQLHRVCLFDAHVPTGHLADRALSLPEVEAIEQAAGPLLPAGRLCSGAGYQARALGDHAAWRPWVLDRRRLPGELSGARLALYLNNRALTGPESARQYRTYLAMRDAAIEMVTHFYRSQFGRTPAEAKRLAVLYLDLLVADGFEVDPDDISTAALFAEDYAGRHGAQKAALAGDLAALRAALGPEPKAIAKGVKGDLDEPLVTDALEHPEVLRALLEMDFDPNETGASGRTALMVAARLDLVEAAGILAAHGASLDTGATDAVAQAGSAGDALCMMGETAATDTPGRTALSYAVELGSPEMVRRLVDHGAATAKPDSAGHRPADYLKNRTGDPVQSDKIAEMLK